MEGISRFGISPIRNSVLEGAKEAQELYQKTVRLIQRIWQRVMAFCVRQWHRCLSLSDLDTTVVVLRRDGLPVFVIPGVPSKKTFAPLPLGSFVLGEETVKGARHLAVAHINPETGAVTRRTFHCGKSSLLRLAEYLEERSEATEKAIARLKRDVSQPHAPQPKKGETWRDVLQHLQKVKRHPEDAVFLAWDSKHHHFRWLHTRTLDDEGDLKGEPLAHLHPEAVKMRMETERKKLAAELFDVLWVPQREESAIREYLQKMAKVENNPIAKIGFGNPGEADTISFFFLDKDDAGHPAEIDEEKVALTTLEELNEVYDSWKRSLDDRDRERIQSWNEKLRQTLGAAFFSEKDLPIEWDDFAGRGDQYLVSHESGEDYAVHVRVHDEVQSKRVKGPPDEIHLAGCSWLFSQRLGPKMRSWLGRDDVPAAEIPCSVADPQPEDFKQGATGEVHYGQVLVKVDEENQMFHLFTLNPMTHEVQKILIRGLGGVPMTRGRIRRLAAINRSLQRQRDEADPLVSEAYGDRFVDLSRTVTREDFEGKPRGYFLIQPNASGGYQVFTSSGEGSDLKAITVCCESPQRYPSDLERHLIHRLFKPLFQREGEEGMVIRLDPHINRKHFRFNPNSKDLELDRVVFIPDLCNRRIIAYRLSPELGVPIPQQYPLDEFNSFSEIRDILRHMTIIDQLTALDRVRNHIGQERLWDLDQERWPQLDGEDYRVAVCPSELKIAVLAKDPIDGEVRMRKATGLSPIVVDETVEATMEALQRAKALQAMVTDLEDVELAGLDEEVDEEDWSPSRPRRIVVQPAMEDYTEFSLFFSKPGRTLITEWTVDRVDEIPEALQEIRDSIEVAKKYEHNVEALKKISKNRTHELPPPPSGVEVKDLKQLFLDLYEKVGKPKVAFTKNDLDRISSQVEDFVANIKDKEGLRGYDKGHYYVKLHHLLLLIIAGLQERKDAQITFDVIASLLEAADNCGPRVTAQAGREYKHVFNLWKEEFAGQWKHQIREWLDDLKLGVVNELVASLNVDDQDQVHCRNFIVKALDRAAIKIPPNPEIDIVNDPFINLGRHYFGKGLEKPAQEAYAVIRFRKAYEDEIVETIQSNVNAGLYRNGKFCQQVMDVLHHFVEYHLLTKEERQNLQQEAQLDYDATLASDDAHNKETIKEKELRASDAYTKTKVGVLHEKLFDERLLKYKDEHLIRVELTEKGTAALLFEMKALKWVGEASQG